jgi:ATP-dependent Clp protease ATP-binding subunit ClpA
MNISIPIYIEQQPQQNSPPLYLVRPLFLDEPVVRDEELQRAVSKFARAARKELEKIGKKRLQSEIAAYTFAPEVEEQLLQVSLTLKERSARGKFLFVLFNVLDRRVAFTPSIPHLWFEIGRGEKLETRAQEVLNEYFRNHDRQSPAFIPNPEELMVQGLSQTGLVELKIEPPVLARSPRQDLRARLFGEGEMEGEWELQSVGRCLNELFPHDLNRAIGCEGKVEELTRLLKTPDQRPILLLGPRLSGKSTIIEEYVYRRTAVRKSAYLNRRNVWLLSPQRLISGMSYVGQWENRLLAILKHAQKRKHILYFDDLLGLFKAGISAQSNLSVAQVLKPYIERREVRILAEITPESFRVLREKDRGLADLFHTIRIDEPAENETMRLMLNLIRSLEAKHRCRFDAEVLPAVVDLGRRYQREAAFPGKAALMLRQLAVKFPGQEIARAQVLEEFQAKSGLSLRFLDDSPLDRAQPVEFLSAAVMGQPAAVEACTDALLLAKAQLNDPGRPLASFLFLGPTGVGKTQCAKSLAQYLFSNEERLIRFDMNEFASYDSVARLAGTFDQPDGLLTAAVRRQPFGVILLDEIEKAHPDVFNLLLQVMGEGRLSDALGRTTDFGNAILILTSNLGVKEASSGMGFNRTRGDEVSIYTQAAEKFFSPEFFNRIDRIIPFNRLDRKTVGEIARKLITDIFARDGVARRKIVLRVAPEAIEKIVDAGYHPQFGARALKRELEKQLAQPLARMLSGTPLSSPTILDVLPGPKQLRVLVRELVESGPGTQNRLPALLDEPSETIERIGDFLARIEESLEALRPSGPISIDEIGPEQQRYFVLNEMTRSLRDTCDRIVRKIEQGSRKTTRLTSTRPVQPSQREARPRVRPDIHPRRLWKELFATEDIHDYLREITVHIQEENTPLAEQLMRAIREAAIIEAFSSGAPDGMASQALLMLRSLGNDLSVVEILARRLEQIYARQLAFDVNVFANRNRGAKSHTSIWLHVIGWNALQFARIEEGTHLFLDGKSVLCPVQVKVFPTDAGQRPRAAVKSHLRGFREWQKQIATSDLSLDTFPWPLDPVIRLYSEDSPGSGRFANWIDLRSGATLTGNAHPIEERNFLIASLALPEELLD